MYVCTFARVASATRLDLANSGPLYPSALRKCCSSAGRSAAPSRSHWPRRMRANCVASSSKTLSERRQTCLGCSAGDGIVRQHAWAVPQCAAVRYRARLYGGCALLLVGARLGGVTMGLQGLAGGCVGGRGLVCSCACVPERACEQVSVCCMLCAWLSVLYAVMLCVQPHVRPCPA